MSHWRSRHAWVGFDSSWASTHTNPWEISPGVFEEAYRRCYAPFFDVLTDFPKVPFALHYSGILFDWLEATHPEFLDRLADFVARGQAELLTGGYYEPILAAIPDADKVGQIQRMTSYLSSVLGCAPEACGWRSGCGSPIWPSPLPRRGSST